MIYAPIHFVAAALQLPDAGHWASISDSILAQLSQGRSKPNDPYTTMTAGISVDRVSGDVYLLVNNIGICKSTDAGRSFTLVSGTAVTGRFETGWGVNIDPSGGRLMCFTIYGSSAYSPDAGKSWIPSKLSHLDYGAVDWADTGKAFLAVGHESGGTLDFSSDTGATWITLGSGFWGVGLFDHKTLLATKAGQPGIVRSTDGGQTWTPVSDESIAAPVMVGFKGVGYWLGEHGLLVSRDRGATWSLTAATPKGAALGPMFGADARHMVVGAPDGLYETNNGGKTWTLAAPPAPDVTVLPGGKYATYGWDPIRRILYASQMMKPAYRYIETP